MEKIKYNQKQEVVMRNKKTISVLAICLYFLISLVSVNAVYQQNLLTWEFEEGSGNIVLDSSGNNYYGIITGATFDAETKMWGNYASRYDGNNGYITTITQATIPDTLTLNMWVYKKSNTGERLFYLIKDNVKEHFKLVYNQDLSQFRFYYYTNLNTTENVTIPYVYPLNTWGMITASVDYNTNSFKLLVNKVEIYNSVIPTTFVSQDTDNFLKLGVDLVGSDDFKGRIDAVNIYDFDLNGSQLDSLYSSNTITLIQEEIQPEVNDTTQETIINSTYPLNNGIVYNNENIEIVLNKKASCELYLDNNLVDSRKDILGFTYPLLNTLNGNHSYFVYCSYIINGTSYYQLTNQFNFLIDKPSKTIDFYLYDVDGNPLSNYDDLYLTTPCFQKTELSKYYIPEKEAYIQHLVNGQASFNLSYSANYDFCLMKGKINAKDDFYSLNYNLPDVTKQVDLGKLFVTNSTYTYSLKVDDTDLYGVAQPEFWGKTWASLFQLVAGVVIGGLIILIGLMAGVDKLIVVGGLIVAIGMGLSITTFVGAII